LENKTIFQPLDFVRLVRSSARYLKGANSVPFLMDPRDLANLSFADCSLSHLVIELNSFFSFFFSAPWLKAPTPFLKIKDFAESLLVAYSRTNVVNFSSLDANGKKRVTSHSYEMIMEEANGTAFLLSGVKRILSTVPLESSFGFVFSLLLPRFLGIPVIELPPSPTLSGVSLQKGDLIVLFPQLLKKLTVVPPLEVTLLSSSSPPLDGRLFKAARNIGFFQLIEVYGTSVTGALGYRKSGGPYELFSHFFREGEKAVRRVGTGEIFNSKRLEWRKERLFGHSSQSDEHLGGNL
jgi:hypothetical protein